MTETGWQAIGRIARMRRERLGLKQEDLAQYGGPGVSTVGKFERAAQDRFPLRTQHQMEKALGWSRTVIEQVVGSIEKGELTADDWEYDLVEEDIPDLSTPQRPAGVDLELDVQVNALNAIARILVLVPADHQDEALRAAVAALLPFITITDVEHIQPARIQADFGFTDTQGNLTLIEAKEHAKIPRAARHSQSRGRGLRRLQDEEAEANQDEGAIDVAEGAEIIDTDAPLEQPQPAGAPPRPDAGED